MRVNTKTTFLVTAVAIATVLPSGAGAQTRARRFALVVSENRGDNKDQPLKFTDDDAMRVADVLRSVGGVHENDIVVRTSLTPRTLMRAIDELTGRLAREAKKDRDELGADPEL